MLEISGTSDCIAEYDGVPSIVNPKTSRTQKYEEWDDTVQDYFLQATAHGVMRAEHIGQGISQLAIIISSENRACDVFVKNIACYMEPLNHIISKYYDM